MVREGDRLVKSITRKKFKGFSILEVMLAMALLSMGILAILGVFPMAQKLNRQAWVRTTAYILAQQKMDQILGDNQFISVDANSDNCDAIPQGYRRWWGEPDPGGNPRLQLIHVEVAWVDRYSGVQRVELAGMVAP